MRARVGRTHFINLHLGTTKMCSPTQSRHEVEVFSFSMKDGSFFQKHTLKSRARVRMGAAGDPHPTPSLTRSGP